MGLFVVFMVFFSIAVLIAVVALYVCYSLGLYTLAQNRGLQNAWLAWIPIINRYLLGELTGDEMWNMRGSKWILPFGPFVCGLLSVVGIGIVLEIGYLVYYYMVLFKLYKTYKPENADLYVITSIVLRFMIPVWIFVIRNNRPIQEERTVNTGQNYSPESDKKINSTIEYSSPGIQTDFYSQTATPEPLDDSYTYKDRDSVLSELNKPKIETPISDTGIRQQQVNPDQEKQINDSIDFDKINKNIDQINKIAQKAHDEAPGAPIHLTNEPVYDYKNDVDVESD